MGKSSGGGSSTTVQKADPWVGQQPALSKLYSGAMHQFNSGGPAYYGNSTIAAQSPVTLQAQKALYDRAIDGSYLNNVGQGQAVRTLNDGYLNAAPGNDMLEFIGQGGMLGSNPFIDATFRKAANSVGDEYRTNVMPGLASMYSRAGRFGSGQMGEALSQAEENYGRTIGDLATGIYGQNYGQERVLQNQALGELGTQFGRERALQMGALGSMPAIANQDYVDINALAELGASMDARQQGLLDADISRFNYYEQLPEHNLAFLNQMVNGGYPGGSSVSQGTSKERGSPVAGALGGALLGSSILPALGSSGALGSTAAASQMMGGAGINALGGMGLGTVGLLGGALLGGLFS